MLFHKYGALITEICHLFGCMDLRKVEQKIWAEYRLPLGGVAPADFSEEDGQEGQNTANW